MCCSGEDACSNRLDEWHDPAESILYILHTSANIILIW
jgi:hypothetical protein